MKTTSRRSRVKTERATMTASAAKTERRQLERSVSWTGRERLRFAWYRLRLTISEMNYASRRMVQLQMRLPARWPAVPPSASDKA